MVILTLLGPLLHFLSSTFPEIIKQFRDSQDRKHGRAILRQMEQQRLAHCHRMKEIQFASDLTESQALYRYANHPTGSPWVEALQASVRPVITHAFFLVFAMVKVAALVTLLQTEGVTVAAALQATWDEETQALCCCDVILVRQPSDQQDASGWLMRHVTEEALNLIKRFEGISHTIYICRAGYPTIGYGHLVLAHEQDQFAAGITPPRQQSFCAWT